MNFFIGLSSWGTILIMRALPKIGVIIVDMIITLINKPYSLSGSKNASNKPMQRTGGKWFQLVANVGWSITPICQRLIVAADYVRYLGGENERSYCV